MPPPNERIRTTKACVACSIRKIKCDGEQPCAHCVRFFDGECFYTAAKKRGPPKGCPARGGHKKRQLNEANKAAAAAAAAAGQAPAATTGTATSPTATAKSSSKDIKMVQVQVPGGPQVAPGSSPPGATVHFQQQIHPQQQQQPLVQQMPLISPPILNTSHSPLIRTGALQRTNDPFDDSMMLPALGISPLGGIDRSPPGPSPRSIVSTLSGDPSSLSGLSMSSSYATRAGLTSEAIDDLILVFETFIHPHWPVIYVPALRSLRSLEKQQPLVFDAVLAVSAAHTDTASSAGPSSPTGYFSSGTGRPMSAVCDDLTESVRQRVLATINSRDHVPSLQTVQALIMITLVDLGCGRSSLAYQMGGFAARLVVDLGLHTQYPDYMNRKRDSRTTQERSRTLWACFILDKMIAAICQRPPTLRLVDIDAARPSEMERDELDLWLSGNASHAFLQPHARETMESIKSHSLSAFNAWVDVMAILEVILSQVYRPSTRRARMEGRHVDGYEETVVSIDADLQNWRQNLPPHLQWSDSDEHAHVNVGLHLLTCRGWYHICCLLLHRPQVPFLDPPETPDGDPADKHFRPRPASSLSQSSHRLPSGADASRHAATAICKMMEDYEATFRTRKFASSWVYLVFQAATVHAGLAAHDPTASASSNAGSSSELLAPNSKENTRESARRLEQCIRWLDQIALQWSSAGRHVEILRNLSAVGARTRPPSPAPEGFDLGTYVTESTSTNNTTPFEHDPALSAAMDEIPLDVNAWMLLWASMPTAGADFSLWQQCFPDMAA